MRRKVYGQSKNEECIFCGGTSLSMNEQGLPVCKDHKNKKLEDKKCICGEWLDIKTSKWGPFFTCRNCGAISIKKAMNMDEGGFKLNKKYRQDSPSQKDVDPVEGYINKGDRPKEKVYTLKELDSMWEDK